MRMADVPVDTPYWDTKKLGDPHMLLKSCMTQLMSCGTHVASAAVIVTYLNPGGLTDVVPTWGKSSMACTSLVGSSRS